MRPISSFSHCPGRENDNNYRLSHSTETCRGNRWTRGESGYRSSCGSCRDCPAIPLHCDREDGELVSKKQESGLRVNNLSLSPSLFITDEIHPLTVPRLHLFVFCFFYLHKDALVLVSLLCWQEKWGLYS